MAADPDLNTLKQDLTRRMDGALEALKREFGGLRTGRASPALLDPVKVEAYGSMMPLNQVATVAVPEARMITVQVWDRSMTNSVGCGDPRLRSWGSTRSRMASWCACRLPILTEERRNELAKTAAKYAEKRPYRGARRAPGRHGTDQSLAEEARDWRG